jgi:hypothetical protein
MPASFLTAPPPSHDCTTVSFSMVTFQSSGISSHVMGVRPAFLTRACCVSMNFCRSGCSTAESFDRMPSSSIESFLLSSSPPVWK